MPTRLLREGILTSDRVRQLCPDAELFYRRLMSVVDDFGRFDARPEMLASACWPLTVRDIDPAELERWLAACEDAHLLTTYTVGGRQFLMLRDFRQQIRATRSKYPEPPAEGAPVAQRAQPPKPRKPPEKAAKPRQEHIDPTTGEIIPMPPVDPDPPPPAPPVPALPSEPPIKQIVTKEELASDGLSQTTANDWLAHRRSKRAPLTHTAWEGIKREAERARWTIEAACSIAMARGWTGFSASWLERERQDELAARKGNGTSHESFQQRAARERMEEFAPSIAAKKPGVVDIDEAQDVTFRPSH